MDSRYHYSDRWQPWDKKNPLSIHSTPELIEAMRTNPNIEVEARVIAVNAKERTRKKVTLNRESFIEAVKGNANRKFKESADFFAFDMEGPSQGVGKDYVPLLGGPFNKQLYSYDYQRMHQLAFFAYHHDPVARAVVQITRDFTLGRGYRVDCDSPQHLAVWRAFEDVNDLQTLMRQLAEEMSIYGEVMPWFLPNGATKIGYQLRPGQEVPRGILPRVRLIDPSVIWEIVTYPEDITRVLYYQWVAPTQFQIYTGRDGGSVVPGTKFIFQQIPADEVLHFKVNSVSNEKRGRSDLFPVLGYLKRLRDSIQYSIISMQKQSAWAIDTTVKGSAADVEKYASMIASETIAPAGSEFVHNEAVTRQFLSNSAGKSGQSDAFNWCLSMIAAGTGIPVQYFGTHLSGATTRASALVATEPVAKKFEMRQGDYERILKAMAKKLFATMGMEPIDIEVTFPELVVQDRSAKLKDLAVGEAAGWFSKRRVAEIAAKELGITEYDYEKERAEVEAERGAGGNPLTAMGSALGAAVKSLAQPADQGDDSTSGVSGQMRRQVASNDRN